MPQLKSAPWRAARSTLVASAILVTVLPAALLGQKKQRFASFDEAMRSSGQMAGRSGPRGVNWIDGGARFSYSDRDAKTNRTVLRAADPATGKDTLLFSSEGLTFPGTTDPFDYQSFQWARDSKHLVFQANFQPIYRRSGICRLLRLLAGRPKSCSSRPRARARPSSRPTARCSATSAAATCTSPTLATRQETRLTSDAHGARLQRPLRLGVRGGVRAGPGVELVARQPAHRLLADRRERRSR